MRNLHANPGIRQLKTPPTGHAEDQADQNKPGGGCKAMGHGGKKDDSADGSGACFYRLQVLP
jgi:hypothetical protein